MKKKNDRLTNYRYIAYESELDFLVSHDRVKMVFVSAAEGDKFAAEINKFAEEIRTIGPNPIRL
jgi:coenzyme F420-reducing hydrogenase delta subunit